ncbi:MAG: 16S rRNA (guanine(527)-N(7))-methyltransferase RsmG [Bacillota bacterium]
MEDNKLLELIEAGLDELKLPKRDDIVDNLLKYLKILYEENQKYNLIGPAEPREIVVNHFYDSMAHLACLNMNKYNNGLDLGTGAGLPGFVWKIIYPELPIYLLDSRKKRIKFLREVTDRLKLKEIFPLRERAERLGQNQEWREKFSFVSARAVAELNVLLEYVLPLVDINGDALLFKGPDYKQELEESAEIISFFGGSEPEIISIDVPKLNKKRYLVKIEKNSKTPIKYPRRVGIPQKRPLKKEDINA